jgi:hypothetical protein
MSITSQGNPRFARRIGSVKAKAGYGLGTFCRDSAQFFARKETSRFYHPAQKTFDAEGEALEHALTKSFRIGMRRSKVFVHRYGAFLMRPSSKNARAIIRTLFRLCGKRWIGRRI